MCQLLTKFKAFKERIINERELLELDVQKFINQLEFDKKIPRKASDQDNVKFIDFNFFKQQFNIVVRPCTLMVEKLEQYVKLHIERKL